jgi:hypothetical protein
MKPRHAAVLALVGWYLLMPTVCSPNSPPCVFGRSAPLHKWTRGGYFDSAAACGDRLNTLKRQARQFEPRAKSKVYKYQCVSEDDPRLKGN